MNKFSILAITALSALTQAIEFPEGETCCRAYTEANKQGDYQDFCTKADSSLPKQDKVWWAQFDELTIEKIGSYECMPDAAFSFCQQLF